MATLSDMKHRERKRLATLNNLKLAKHAGLPLLDGYMTRAEVDEMQRDGLITTAPASAGRYFITDHGETIRRRLAKKG